MMSVITMSYRVTQKNSNALAYMGKILLEERFPSWSCWPSLFIQEITHRDIKKGQRKYYKKKAAFIIWSDRIYS